MFVLCVCIDHKKIVVEKVENWTSDSLIYRGHGTNRTGAISAKLIPVKVENSQNYCRAGRHIISQLAVVFVGDFRDII